MTRDETQDDTAPESREPAPLQAGGGRFPVTRWSLVSAAGSDRTVREQALERLCRDYWPPLYTFIRSQGRTVEDAKDLTQALLAGLIDRDAFEGLSAEHGRFRTFLLRCAKNHLANDWNATEAQKRGGGFEHISIDTEEGEAYLAAKAGNEATPDILYERQWSARLLRHVMDQLSGLYRAEGKSELFDQLRPMLAGGEERGRYGELAAELAVSEPSLRMMVFRMRKRYRTLLREEIAHTVDDPAEIDDEISYLLSLYQRD